MPSLKFLLIIKFRYHIVMLNLFQHRSITFAHSTLFLKGITMNVHNEYVAQQEVVTQNLQPYFTYF